MACIIPDSTIGWERIMWPACWSPREAVVSSAGLRFSGAVMGFSFTTAPVILSLNGSWSWIDQMFLKTVIYLHISEISLHRFEGRIFDPFFLVKFPSLRRFHFLGILDGFHFKFSVRLFLGSLFISCTPPYPVKFALASSSWMRVQRSDKNARK